MKTFVIALLIVSSVLSINAQVASVDHLEFTSSDSSSKAMKISPELLDAKQSVTLVELGEIISSGLKKNEHLRKNNTEGDLILEIFVEENGKVHSFKIAESNSELMTKIISQMMEPVKILKMDKKAGKGISKIKIPVHYSL